MRQQHNQRRQMLKYYFTIGSFKSKNLDLPDGDSKKTKFFDKGKLVIGKEHEIVTGDIEIVTPDGYPLPKEMLKEVEDQAAIKNLQESNKRVQQIMSRDFIKDTVRANKFSTNGAVWCGMAGVAFGWIFKKPVLWCGFIGVVVGGFAGYGISKIEMKK